MATLAKWKHGAEARTPKSRSGQPLEDKKGGGQLQTESLIRIVTFVFTLFCDIHGIHCMESFEK